MNTIVVTPDMYNICCEEYLLFTGKPIESFIFTDSTVDFVVDVPSDEFAINVKEIYRFNINTNNKYIDIDFMAYDKRFNNHPIVKGDYGWKYHEGDLLKGEYVVFKSAGAEITDQANVCTLLNFIAYVMLKGLERHREVRKASGKKYKYSREHRLSTNQNKIFLFNDIINYVSDKYIPSKKTHTMVCPSWEVRGHYRHYKSGKVVFIQSFKKGKHRDTVEPKAKEYIVGRSKP